MTIVTKLLLNSLLALPLSLVISIIATILLTIGADFPRESVFSRNPVLFLVVLPYIVSFLIINLLNNKYHLRDIIDYKINLAITNSSPEERGSYLLKSFGLAFVWGPIIGYLTVIILYLLGTGIGGYEDFSAYGIIPLVALIVWVIFYLILKGIELRKGQFFKLMYISILVAANILLADSVVIKQISWAARNFHLEIYYNGLL